MKNSYLNILLFVLTFISTLTVGAMHEGINVVEEPLKLYKVAIFIALLLILYFMNFPIISHQENTGLKPPFHILYLLLLSSALSGLLYE
jgi:hypothetical protein